MLGLGGYGAWAGFKDSCSLSSLQPVSIGENSFVYAADGTLLGSIPAERNRQPVSLSRISPWMAKAVISTEDRRFYQHGGVDWLGIVRAFWRDLTKGKVVEGGSSIPQQVVRNLYPVSRERTLQRKVKEACLAVKLSKHWSKDRILATWMNQVYFGNHAYGVEAASQTYFSKHAKDLSLEQAALLAGLPQAPSLYDPILFPQTALARRAHVLKAMYDNGDISFEQYQAAVADRNLHLRPGQLYTQIREPYFFSYVRDQLIARVRRPDRPVGRAPRVHDDRPGVPARGDQCDQGHALPQGRPGGRSGLDQPRERSDPGDDLGLSGQDQERVQPRRPGEEAGRLDLQDVRAHPGGRRRDEPGLDRATSRRRSPGSPTRPSLPGTSRPTATPTPG